MIESDDLKKYLTEIIDMTKKIVNQAKSFDLSLFRIDNNGWKILLPPSNAINTFEYLMAALRHLSTIEYNGVVLVNIVEIQNLNVEDKLLIAYYIPKGSSIDTENFTCIFTELKPGWEFGENKFGLVEAKGGKIFNVMQLQ